MQQNNIKKLYPAFQANPKLVYLDNAATSQMPLSVIEAVNEYNVLYRANVHRGIYPIAEKADAEYTEARKIIAEFINAESTEIIFTSGATYGLNLLAYQLTSKLKKSDNVVLTRMEHHANLIPWQEAAKRHGFKIRYIELTKDGRLDMKSAQEIIDKNTKIVSVVHVSNTLGTINPVEKIVKLAKKFNATTIIDAAQSIAHLPIDVKKIDCDYLVFSGHKIGAPNGTGVLYAHSSSLDSLALKPLFFGGDMVKSVGYESSEYKKGYEGMEAGTPNIGGVIGLGAAVRQISNIKYQISNNESKIKKSINQKIKKYPEIRIVGLPIDAPDRVPIFSFNVAGVHPHDVAEVLGREGVCVRAGHHCTMPLLRYLGEKSTVRASFSYYNDESDVKRLFEALKKVKNIFYPKSNNYTKSPPDGRAGKIKNGR